MANDSYNHTLKDRMAARRADKAMGGAVTSQIDMPMQQAPSRLDASPTPGLDAKNQGPIRYATKDGRMAEQRAATQRSTLNGAFGQGAQKKAQNLEGRKALYRQMQTVGGANISDSMRSQANQLGVPQSRFQAVAGALPAAPEMIARPGAPAMEPKMGSITGSATQPQAPLQGRALAEKNIAEKGIQGAAADYFQRNPKKPSWKTPPPLIADIGKADVMPNKRRR